MAIIKNSKKAHSQYEQKRTLFKKVLLYCLPTMLIISLIPFSLTLIALLLRAIGIIDISDAFYSYVIFPLTLISPVFLTTKVISVLKGSFPRKDSSGQRILIFVMLSFFVSLIILAIQFIISNELLGIYPLDFKLAAYMRAMHASSPMAMFITYISLICVYALLSIMAVCAYFKPQKSSKDRVVSASCMWFVIYYVPILLLFLLIEFISTFVDITGLQKIEIAHSLFNSGMLCALISLMITALIAYPIFYKLTYEHLTSKK